MIYVLQKLKLWEGIPLEKHNWGMDLVFNLGQKYVNAYVHIQDVPYYCY